MAYLISGNLGTSKLLSQQNGEQIIAEAESQNVMSWICTIAMLQDANIPPLVADNGQLDVRVLYGNAGISNDTGFIRVCRAIQGMAQADSMAGNISFPVPGSHVRVSARVIAPLAPATIFNVAGFLTPSNSGRVYPALTSVASYNVPAAPYPGGTNRFALHNHAKRFSVDCYPLTSYELRIVDGGFNVIWASSYAPGEKARGLPTFGSCDVVVTNTGVADSIFYVTSEIEL